MLDDPDDAPFAAAAIALSAIGEAGGDCDIWSNDKHFTEKKAVLFRKYGVKVFTTKMLSELMQ